MQPHGLLARLTASYSKINTHAEGVQRGRLCPQSRSAWVLRFQLDASFKGATHLLAVLQVSNVVVAAWNRVALACSVLQDM